MVVTEQRRPFRAPRAGASRIAGPTRRLFPRRAFQPGTNPRSVDTPGVRRDVLVALGQHHEDGLAVAFAAAIKTNPDPPVRVQLVLDTIVAPTPPQTQTSSEW